MDEIEFRSQKYLQTNDNIFQMICYINEYEIKTLNSNINNYFNIIQTYSLKIKIYDNINI